jgi:hypothetical protein
MTFFFSEIYSIICIYVFFKYYFVIFNSYLFDILYMPFRLVHYIAVLWRNFNQEKETRVVYKTSDAIHSATNNF